MSRAGEAMTISTPSFPGFLKAYNIEEEGAASSEDDNTKDAEALAALKENSACRLEDALSEQKFTEPPPRFSEATLIKELESNGIGRPSTYATIVNTIQERAYVLKEKGKLSPTELGFKINDYLVASLPDLIQVGFTADMENQLDSVEEGRILWTRMLKNFYEKFSKWLAEAKNAGAPEARKAKAVLDLLSSVKTWEVPEKGAKRVYDDKKFYNSVQAKAEQGTTISAKQWEALLNLVVKYASQLKNLKEIAEANGFQKDVEAAMERLNDRRKKREEILRRREDAANNAPPQDSLESVFRAMQGIPWSPPEKRGARVYDDKKFFESLKKQMESGKFLSEKQISALAKIAARYASSIPDYESVAKKLTGSVPGAAVSSAEEAQGEGGASSAPAASAGPGEAEIDRILKAMSEITDWAEPEKKGRRVYNDKEFYESLAKQRASGKVLSFKQAAALTKLAAKYKIS